MAELRRIETNVLILYGTSACHLCEIAADLLRDASLEFEEVDVSESDVFQIFSRRHGSNLNKFQPNTWCDTICSQGAYVYIG